MSATASHLLIRGNARRIPLAEGSVHCCVTSPPYFALRDYEVDGQIGLEESPEAYIAAMVRVFREVRRVLRDDGSVWLNIGDTYFNGKGKAHGTDPRNRHARRFGRRAVDGPLEGFKHKDLIGIPWMLAFALRADGWYLRSEIVWNKPNAMTESVRDRPSKSHETLFLLTKRPQYFYDREAIREPHTMKPQRRPSGRPVDTTPRPGQPKQAWSTASRDEVSVDGDPAGRNKRTVWTIPTHPMKAAHFATMPVRLVLPCIRAGTSEKGCCPRCGGPWRRVVKRTRVATRPGIASKVYQDAPLDPDSPSRRHHGDICGNRDPGRHVTKTVTIGWESTCTCPEARHPVPCRVFDPFGGAMTTVLAAELLGRVGVATELKPEYIAIGRRRLERPHAPAAKPARERASSGQKVMFPDLQAS